MPNRWFDLFLLFIIGLTGPMQFQAVAALAPFLTAQEGLTYTDIGVLTGVFMIAGIFLAAPIGMISAAIGDRLTLALGIALMAISAVAFVFADVGAARFASRLVGGAGAVAVTVLLPKVVTDRFAGREIATALSIIASSVGFGMGLAIAVLPPIAAATSWQVAMLFNAGFSALGVVMVLIAYRDAATQGPASSMGTVLWRINRPELILSALAGIGRGLFSAGYAVFVSFLPPLLIMQGLSPVEASLQTSVAAFVALASVPLGGMLSDWTGKPGYFIVGGSVGTALTCLLVPYVAPALLWIVLFGALRGGCTGGIMTMPSQVLRLESRNTGFAVVSAMYFVCMAVFPAIAGYLLDVTANTAAPMWFAAVLWLAISVLLGVFRYLKRRWIA